VRQFTVTDSHCHLADEKFAADLEAVIGRAKDAGVRRALVILAAGDAAEAAQAQRVLDLWPDTRLSIGVHPHSAHEFSDNPGKAADVVRSQIVATPAARAIGEIGLDYHYDFSPRAVQQGVFRVQVRLARELNRPVVIHTREADADTIAILREEGGGDMRGVLHCFTGNAELARAGLDLGFFISFAGIVSFPKAGELRAVAKQVPLERLLVETDSPFLAPVPYRGKRNEPSYVVRVAATLAEILGMEAEAVARQTTANFSQLFMP
jgi:TatD DNase family protein